MIIKCVWEHNGNDTLLYAENFIGAFARGETKEVALRKIPQEVASYLRWCGKSVPEQLVPEIVAEKESALHIADADTEVIFDTEKEPLSAEEFFVLKDLTLKSAADFLSLYQSIPDKHKSNLTARKTFYGITPVTAEEMYAHTKNVNDYYWREIGVSADNDGTILHCRQNAFALLESQPGYLNNPVFNGSYNEQWSLRKVMRRFIWHDRIHAKAMYRMAVQTFGKNAVMNIYQF